MVALVYCLPFRKRRLITVPSRPAPKINSVIVVSALHESTLFNAIWGIFEKSTDRVLYLPRYLLSLRAYLIPGEASATPSRNFLSGSSAKLSVIIRGDNETKHAPAFEIPRQLVCDLNPSDRVDGGIDTPLSVSLQSLFLRDESIVLNPSISLRPIL